MTQVFLISAMMGIVFYIYTYGIRFLDFTFVDWLLPQKDDLSGMDIVQHYLGWVYYRKSD